MQNKNSLLALLACCALFGFAATAHAQATFDAQSNVTDVLTSAANTTTFAHTTGTGTNRLLLVAVSMNLRNATGTTVTTVTYGGSPLTLLDAITDGAPDTRTEVWYLLNGPTGNNNVVLTMGGITPGENVESVTSATTFTNADQSAPPSATATNSSGAASVTLTGTAATDLVIDFIGARETVTLTPNGAQTAGFNTSTGGTNNDIQAASSGRAAATPNTAMSWTLSATRRWTQIAVGVKQATADVEVTQSALPDPVDPGGVLTYTFHIQNNGPSTAQGVTLTDTIPGTTTFVSSNTTLGSCSGTSTVTCNLGTMTVGQTATVSIQVVAPLTGGLIATNTGTVTTTTSDPVTPNTASATAYSLVQSTVCGTQPGKDGAGGTLAGVINSYWPGSANAAVGATSITVGARRGAAVSITAGDLVLVMQMQDAAIDSNNDDRYGNGLGITGGTTGIGAGYTNANNVGRYEYVVATNTVGAAGGTLNFTGVSGGGGLVYAYTNANATVTQGQRRFQVVRVPQYTTATLGGTVTAAAWNGTSGGILAFDVAGDLALGSTTVNVNGLGFRGGAGLQRAGGAASTDDYRNTLATNVHGVKGEGIAGTPEWVLDGGVNTDVGPQGYPNGDFARGAPGNAGGGGSDGEPTNNQDNSGGGGGANWGRGGGGGNTWASNLARGGFGGAPYYDSPGRVVLGGGGGAGARNNSSGIAAAGAAGGGIVLIRAGRLTGTGTITANGVDAYNDTANDGGGGGGAGGSIVVLTRGGTFGGLTVRANGGRGGDAWRTQAPGVYPGERHGPGGGGGGGYIALNGTPAVSSVTGGASGITTTASDTFGAQPGAIGNVVLTANFDQITGIKSGCTDISVASSDSPDPVIAGNQLTFTQSVTNNSTIVPAYNVVLTQTTPPGTTFVSMTPPAGWSCTTPSVGGTGTVTCTKTDPLAPSTGSGNFTFVVATDPGLANGSTITQPVSTSTSSPEPNTANNSTSTTTSVIRRVDVGVTKVASDAGTDSAFQQGENVTYTLVVSNNGPSRATNVVMTDTLPAGLSFVSVTPGGPTCTQSSGTVTCTYATMNPGATNNISITATITVNTTQITNTANVTRTETDTNPTNDSASATINVLAPTAVHMLNVQASQDERGQVVLDWTTTFEANNLGFNIHRVTADGTREQINKHLIAGSALFTRRGTLPSGRTYRWTDRIDSRAFAQYYIEDIDLDGTRTMHGPVTPAITASAFFEVAQNAATLNEVAAESVFTSDNNGVDGGLGAPGTPKTRPNLTQQWALASQKALTFAIAREGWYRVTKNEIAAAGFDPGNDSNGLSLYSSGVEQPLFVDDGGDGRFDATDAVEFYGIGKDTPSSGTRAYWLVREKPRASLTKPSNGNGKTSVKNTMYTYRRVERSVFFTALTNNGDNDNFFGAIVTNAGASQDLVVENLDPRGANATLTVVLQGGAAGRHRVRLTLNGGNESSLMTVDDMERASASFTIPLSRLRGGTNTLTLTALGGDDDITVVESIELTYPRQLLATNNALKVMANGNTSVTVTGFTSDRIRAFDVTDPAQPSLLATTVEANAGSYRATANAPNGSNRTLVFLAAPRASKPESLALTQPSSWNNKKNAADLLIITHAALASATDSLIAKRKAEGLQTQVVDVQDVYNEFNYGEHGPEALKEFLRRTRDWKTSPRYVILLGDASFDPRNYLGLGNYDFVPTKLVATNFMKTASDDWFADFKDNGLPAIAIGRIPARTLADARTMLDKIVRRTFVNRVNAVADTEFDGAAQWLNGLIPSSYEKKITTADNAFESALTSYVGHGSVELWATGFDGNSAAALRNGTKLPIVAAMTCLNGYFHDLYTTSLAESLLLNPNGGAAAVWASSTLTEPVAQIKAATELYRRLFAGARLGDAALSAKAATVDQDVRRSWILFGDPSMSLK